MSDASDYFRGYARDVGLNPPVGGNDNVQDAIADPGGTGAGPVVLGATGDIAISDPPVTVDADGAAHRVGCVLAGPPDWMNDAGDIIVPGTYGIGVVASAGDAPTVPGTFGFATLSPYSAVFPVDALDVLTVAPLVTVLSIGAGDLPYEVSTDVLLQTDVTATAVCETIVQRLAYNAT